MFQLIIQKISLIIQCFQLIFRFIFPTRNLKIIEAKVSADGKAILPPEMLNKILKENELLSSSKTFFLINSFFY